MSAAKRLKVAPTPADTLRSEIAAICEQIDRRTGAKPGTAERGTYFWFWPRTDCIDTLTALHRDAVTFLANLATNRKESPE